VVHCQWLGTVGILRITGRDRKRWATGVRVADPYASGIVTVAAQPPYPGRRLAHNASDSLAPRTGPQREGGAYPAARRPFEGPLLVDEQPIQGFNSSDPKKLAGRSPEVADDQVAPLPVQSRRGSHDQVKAH
jgi:hypothetical protein